MQLLQAENFRLSAENSRLRAEVALLRANPAIAKGLRGESLVASFVCGNLAKHGAGHDVVAKGGVLIEVKYSSLLTATNSRPIKRWMWTKVFGENGRKQFSRLILIGDSDPRFSCAYSDPKSPYVIFDLSYSDAVELVGGVKAGRRGQIHLTTNPETVKALRSKQLFECFQVTRQELQYRYPKLNAMSDFFG